MKSVELLDLGTGNWEITTDYEKYGGVSLEWLQSEHPVWDINLEDHFSIQ